MVWGSPFLLMVSWPAVATNFTVVPTWAGAVAHSEKSPKPGVEEKRLEVWGWVVAVEPKRLVEDMVPTGELELKKSKENGLEVLGSVVASDDRVVCVPASLLSKDNGLEVWGWLVFEVPEPK